jgi:hypothetical protein
MTAKAHCHCEERSDQRQGEGFDALAKMLNIVRLALIQALIVPLGIVRIEGNHVEHGQAGSGCVKPTGVQNERHSTRLTPPSL